MLVFIINNSALAQHSCKDNYSSLAKGYLSFLQLDSAGRRHCRPEVCKAFEDVVCATGATVPPAGKMGGAFLTDRGYQAYLNELHARRAGFGVNHPRRNAIYCQILAQSAALIGTEPLEGEADQVHEAYAIEALAEMTVRIDRGGHACADQIKAAVPKTDAAQATFHAHGECLFPPTRCLRRYDPPIVPVARKRYDGSPRRGTSGHVR
jgi:hypothetical protein